VTTGQRQYCAFHAPIHHSIYIDLILRVKVGRLVERVGAGTPVCKEQAEADSLEDASESTNGDSISGTLLGDDLCDDRRSSRSKEDQRPQISSTLIAESTCGIDQGTNTIGLDGGADERATPSCGGGRGFLGLDELLSTVGLLRAAVCLAEEGSHDCEGGGMVENGA